VTEAEVTMVAVDDQFRPTPVAGKGEDRRG
jgi:acyl-CoA hydrolase